MPGKNKKKRRRYTKLTLNEISGVDSPAQEGAVAVALFKRAEEVGEPTDGDKGFVPDVPALTTAAQGHAHILDLSVKSGETSTVAEGPYAGEHRYHYHPYVVDDGGRVTIGEAEGHTHEVAAVAAKTAGDGTNDNGDTMSDQNKDGAVDNADAERIAKLEAELAEKSHLASMTDEQKAHYAGLDGDQAKAFLEADAAKRTEAVEAAKAADAVVYTSKTSGDVFRKSDDQRLVEMAKREDEREERLTKSIEREQTQVYKARAKEEINHLPGTEDVKVALLKAVDGIEDEELREGALATIKANDASVGKNFERTGTNGGAQGGDGADAEEKLDAMAKSYAEEHKVAFAKAYREVTRTPEGRELYAQTQGL